LIFVTATPVLLFFSMIQRPPRATLFPYTRSSDLEEGMLIDVASGGEMAIALAADVPAERLVLHGNNKSDDELRRARHAGIGRIRSEEHTSELQSRFALVCRLLLGKKKAPIQNDLR